MKLAGSIADVGSLAFEVVTNVGDSLWLPINVILVEVERNFDIEVLEVDTIAWKGEDVTNKYFIPALLRRIEVVTAIVNGESKIVKPLRSDPNMWQNDSALKLADCRRLSVLITY